MLDYQTCPNQVGIREIEKHLVKKNRNYLKWSVEVLVDSYPPSFHIPNTAVQAGSTVGEK